MSDNSGVSDVETFGFWHQIASCKLEVEASVFIIIICLQVSQLSEDSKVGVWQC